MYQFQVASHSYFEGSMAYTVLMKWLRHQYDDIAAMAKHLCHWYRSMAESVCHAPSNFQWYYKLKFFQQKLQIFSNKYFFSSHNTFNSVLCLDLKMWALTLLQTLLITIFNWSLFAFFFFLITLNFFNSRQVITNKQIHFGQPADKFLHNSWICKPGDLS